MHRLGCAGGQQLLLGGAAARRQLRKARRRQAAFARRQARLDEVGEREIHVVATEHQVVADADAGQVGSPSLIATWISVRSVVPPPTSQTSSSRVSASSVGELVLMAEQPVVESGLRLFEQAQIGQAGLPRGFQRQRARAFVEGGGNGQDHLLLFERCLREAVQPGGADMRQIAGAGRDRRDLDDLVFGAPGQDGARRSTEACDSQLLALATRRPGTCAPRSSARRPVITGSSHFRHLHPAVLPRQLQIAGLISPAAGW
jgi:hypothetical protein